MFDNIIIRGNKFYQVAAGILFFISASSVVLLGFVFRKREIAPKSILDLIIWILFFLYIYLILLSIKSTPFSILGFPIFFRYLYFWEIIVYLAVFSGVLYMNNCCFSKPSGYISLRLWYLNSISMAVALLSLGLLVPQIDYANNSNYEHLRFYYTAMTQVFATIIAVVVAFSPTLHKVPIEKEIIEIFVKLYAIIVLFSFLGLSSLTSMNFIPIIDDLSNINNFYNFISISVFEITLLLIPPAIISLIELLKRT